MDYEKPISYLEFKLNKELAYENTYGKDDKIKKLYELYKSGALGEEEFTLSKKMLLFSESYN